MCGPRQLLFFQCGPEMPKVWTPCLEYLLFTLLIVWLAGICRSLTLPGIRPHIACLRKDQKSEFDVWFLLSAFHFSTIVKSKVS